MVPNSPCQPPWLTWNFWMSTLWQLVGFYVSMPCSQKLCKHVQIHQHQHGTYLALIPLMNFNMGALTWNPFFCCPTLVFGRVNITMIMIMMMMMTMMMMICLIHNLWVNLVACPSLHAFHYILNKLVRVNMEASSNHGSPKSSKIKPF